MIRAATIVLGVTLLAQLPEDVVLPGGTPVPSPTAEVAPIEDVPRLRAVSIVVVDPGHGGDDTGARDEARGALEKDLTLAIARKLEAKFSAAAMGSGARVLLTRDGDVRTANATRTSLANEARADLFLSLHVNAAPSPSARGFRVAYHDGSGADAVLARPRDPRAGAPLPAQPWATAQRSREAESARFADIVRESLAAKVTLPDRGLRRLPLSVLEGASCPAVLVELGYLTNPDESLALSTDAVQDAVAEALAEAVLRMDAVLAGASADDPGRP